MTAGNSCSKAKMVDPAGCTGFRRWEGRQEIKEFLYIINYIPGINYLTSLGTRRILMERIPNVSQLTCNSSQYLPTSKGRYIKIPFVETGSADAKK